MEGLNAGGLEAPASEPSQPDRSPYTRADLYDLVFRDYVADLDFYLAAARATLGDMRDFTMSRRYACVLIPFNAFAHNLSADDQVARPAPEHQGLLVVSAWKA